MLPDFEVAGIDLTFTHRIIAKVRNNSSSPFQGNVEMALQIAGYGLVYRNRVFNLNLPAHGQIIDLEMPCDVPDEKMRMDHANRIAILVSFDPDKKNRRAQREQQQQE